jgi:hypothetical protein
MESWEESNYLTRDPALWVKLMNDSTVEWGVGPFPFNVAAIPGDLNGSQSFRPGTLVITNAGIPNIGDKDVEKVVFGVASGLIISWGIGWLLYSWKYNKFRVPLNSRRQPPLSTSVLSHSTATTQAAAQGKGDGGPYRSHKAFGHELLTYYYEPYSTETEEYQKDTRNAGVESDDVEEVSQLLRKLYENDMWVWSRWSAPAVSEIEKDQHRSNSDAILQDIFRIVDSWDDRHTSGWSNEARQQLQAIKQQLDMIRAPYPRYNAQYHEWGREVA